MTDYEISIGVAFNSPQGATNNDFERFFMTAVVAFEKISEGPPSCSCSLANRTADFSVLVPGASKQAALAQVLADVKAALEVGTREVPDGLVFTVRDQQVRETYLA